MVARALVVAVPTTKVPGLPPLPGTTQDAIGMADLLNGRGFSDVRLHAGGLVVDEFVTELLRLRADTQAGDLALVHFSGHGYRVADLDGDETDDHLDESLVLSGDKLLVDDWFRETFWPGTAEGSWWVTCADTCFSGSIFRSVRYVREEEIPDEDTTPLPPIPSGPARIWLAAVGDGEKALEIDRESRQYGWYTQQLREVLAEEPGITYSQLWTRLQKRWKAARASWLSTVAHPQMAMTDAALLLAGRPAFASLDFDGS